MVSGKPGIYGDFTVGPAGSVPTKHVDRILGFRVGYRPEGPAGIDLQLQAEGKTQSLTIGIGDAMFLLSTLKSMQLNEDLPFPEDPRDPNWKASDYVSKKS